MDPGEYETNTLIINNVSSVAFKIYEPVVPTSSPYNFAFPDVEGALRNAGHLVYADSLRRALWCFSLTGSDGSSMNEAGASVLGPTLDICGHTLSLVDEGTLEPISLLKTRIMTPNSLNTPSTSSSSGAPFDSAFRPATATGGGMPSTNAAGDTEGKMSFGSTVEGYGSIPNKDIHDYFVTSVVASLSERFCSKTGAIPLDSKSFLLPAKVALPGSDASRPSSVSILASLRVHLTTTGSLLIGISLTLAQGILADVSGLSPWNSLQSGSTVLAAPFGMFGTSQALTESDQYSTDGSIAQSPDTQVTRTRPDAYGNLGQWQSICCKLLETRGVSTAVLSRSSWLSVSLLRPKPNESRTDARQAPAINPQLQIMWPAVLCYRKRERDTTFKMSSEARNFQNEFDALKHAEAWFMGSTEREEVLAKRKQEREAANSQKDAAEGDPRLLQSGLLPPGPRRTSNAAAAGGAMYPTPPDGVQSAPGVPPFTEGNTSSPGNQVPSAGMGDLDSSLAVPGNLGDGFGEGWEATQAKREQSFNQENWDLNHDVFVETDITDADFNFFDEEPHPMNMSVPDLSDLGNEFSKIDAPTPSVSHEHRKRPAHTEMKMEHPVAPPVFAKPELKHARSTLGEIRQREKGRIRPANGIKRPLSPFNYTTVYKKLKASFESRLADPVPRSGRRGSAFDRLEVDKSFTVVNKKYEQNGRFNFKEERPEENTFTSASPPTTNYLRQHGKGRATLKDLPPNLGARVAGIAGTLDDDHIQRDVARADESTSDADDISLVSDQDDVSDYSDEPSSPTKSGLRRRRLADDVESIAPSIRDLEPNDESLVSAVDISRLSINDSSAASMPTYFADPEPLGISSRIVQSDEEFILTAQCLTEQAVSGYVNYDLPCAKRASLDISGSKQEIIHSLRSSLQTLQNVLPSSLQTATACQLRQLIDVQDVPLLAAPSRIQPRPPGGPEQRPSLVQIAPPHLELRRYETKLSVLPSAVSFWESLGLGPSQGHKDIYSVSVFPNLEGMEDSADVFLDRLRITYESLKLGSFERMTNSLTVPNGLLSYEVDKTSNTPILRPNARAKQALLEEMAKLAVAIFNSGVNSGVPPRNFVVFFVYSPENPSTIAEACLAFVRMIELYRRAMTERKKPLDSELVLQLVPLDFVATSTSMVVLPPHECIRLCLEVYDRCKLFGGPMPSPAIVLEQQPITQGINFQLRNQPSANILQENSIMHIAYAQSVDERWITAAWTDNRGCKQMTASYCLGRKDRPLTRSFTDIAHEIWTTTHDLISIWKVHWRIIITKVGSMEQHEISDWVTLAQTEIKSSVTLNLLTVDTDPSLQLVPSIVKVSMTSQAAFYSTPVSTPQPSTMSPEQTAHPTTPKPGGASTPSADNTATEADADASLVDVTDTTWGAVVSHRLNTSHSLTDPSPSLISGYLIKRGGARADDPPAVMEVNVVHCEGNPRMHDMLLREMLSVFRGLGTIARARSVTEKEGDVRPWHVAAAEKGVRALYQLM